MKPHQRGAGYVEVALTLDAATDAVGERLLRDIAAFNAHVEAAARAVGPMRKWLERAA